MTMTTVPRTLSDLRGKSPSDPGSDGARGSQLRVQLIETNTGDVPPIAGFSGWRPLGDVGGWYVCDGPDGAIVLNRADDRVWALYSTIGTDRFVGTVDAWVSGNLMLDKCWMPRGNMQRATTGSDPSDDGAMSGWSRDGGIAFDPSEDTDAVLQAVGDARDSYRRALDEATGFRDRGRGSFELAFGREVDLDRFESCLSHGAGDLRLWMVRTEGEGDFRRFKGVDTHSWDPVFLDVGKECAYMAIPGRGCVNAVPRLAALLGARAYCDGVEMLFRCRRSRPRIACPLLHRLLT